MLKFFLLPPVAFLLLVIVGIIFSKVCAVLEAPGVSDARKTDPYACGQRTYDNTTTQDYEQFLQTFSDTEGIYRAINPDTEPHYYYTFANTYRQYMPDATGGDSSSKSCNDESYRAISSL